VAEVRARLARLAEKGRLEPAEASAAGARLRAVDDVAGVGADAPGLVVEAVVEDLAVKRRLLVALEEVVDPGCVLATNTSSLSVTALASVLRHPGRCVGMHFFNPAPLMPLVEVVSGLATDPAVAGGVAATARAWGKTPVHVASTPGFVVNRVARPFYGEALRAYEEGLGDPATLDAVLRDAGGFRMGPFALTDLIGQDVNLAVSRSVWEAFGHDPRYTPSLAQQALVDAGRLGRKTGQGFFSYADGAAPPEPAAAPPATPPHRVTVQGDWGPWTPLWERVSAAGVRIERIEDAGPARARLPGGVVLVPTDGRTATDRAATSGEGRTAGGAVVVLDLALDAATAPAFAVAAADTCPPLARDEVVGLLQATGARVHVLDDLPGLLVARTVARLVDEAVDVVARGVATAADVDTAMRLGTGYPLGPLEWGDRIGTPRVLALLEALAATYGEGRHRPCLGLRRAVLAGRPLREP